MKTLDEIKKTLRDNREAIGREYKAEIVGIFGSCVRGEQKEESDVDVLVRFRKGATLFDFVGFADFLEQKLGMKVDIASERAIRPELKERILEEVVAV